MLETGSKNMPEPKTNGVSLSPVSSTHRFFCTHSPMDQKCHSVTLITTYGRHWYSTYIRLTTKKYVCTVKNLKTVAWKYKYIQRKTAHWNGLMNIYRWSGNWPRCSLLGQLKLQFLMYRWLQFLIDGWLQFLGLSRQSQTLWTESSECWLTLWELEFYPSIFEVVLP